jgi:uncharacterized membrane protein YqaE (UPF0057 family)
MKHISTFMLMSILAIIVASCSVSNTVGGSSLQKRKYTKGFYLNRNHSFRTAGSDKISDSETPVNEEAVREEAAEETKAMEVSVPATVIRPATAGKQEQTEKNQKPVENQKAPAKKKTAEQKNPKPATPARPKRERENEYFIPVKQKSVFNKQQSRHSSGSDDMFILAVIFAILIPPIGVAIYTNIDWKKVLICLLLTILFFIPGMIYALLVVFDVI